MSDLAVTRDTERDHMSPLSPKRRALVTEMVWGGRKVSAAAEAADISYNAALIALRDPSVRKALQSETYVLRSSMKPRALFRLGDMIDQDDNKMAVVAAAGKLLADDGAQSQVNVNVSITPGYAVDMGEWRREKVIEHQRIRIDGAGHGDTLAEDGE